jgi:hypothetical protein
MMNNKKQRFVVRLGLLAVLAFLVLPLSAFAQGNGRGRGKPTEVFVNGQDARDGRWDRQNRDRNNDEWRRRQAAEEARRRGRDWGGDGNYGSSAQMRQTALNAGYNNGIQEGRKDRQRGERFEYRDEGDYSNATEDYNSRFGNRELYRQYFRQGFANGYRDGYRGY